MSWKSNTDRRILYDFPDGTSALIRFRRGRAEASLSRTRCCSALVKGLDAAGATQAAGGEDGGIVHHEPSQELEAESAIWGGVGIPML
jgi:hypothetical protein